MGVIKVSDYTEGYFDAVEDYLNKTVEWLEEYFPIGGISTIRSKEDLISLYKKYMED